MMKRWFSMLMVLLMLCSMALGEESFVDAVPREFTLLTLHDKNDDVTLLQEKLVELGYLSKASGEYDEQTQKAILKLQAAYSLEETGDADEDTQEVLFGGRCYLPLAQGDTGAQVRELQKRLKELSLYADTVDGKYGPTTLQGVQIFQKLYGLNATGSADVDTLAMLYSDLSGAVVLPAPTPTPAPAQGSSNISRENVKFKKKLAYGSTGADVQKVQEKLKELGFFTYKKTTTGYYRNTQAAVKQFQEYNGLKVTGTVDEKTWNALFNTDDPVPVSATPRPTPEPEPAKYYMDVDVKNQVVKVYTYDENKEYNILVRAMICSTGTTKYPSPTGTFTLTERRTRWCTFPQWGGGTAQYWTKINPSIAFHSVMYVNYDEKRLKKESFNNLGSRASHGCIRLTTPDAKWVYENCLAGTDVYIHNDGNTDKETLAFAKYRKNNNSVMLPDLRTFDKSVVPAYRRLKSGSLGDDVTWLQLALTDLGYYQGTITGYFSTMTTSAVKKFQKAYGIKQDGIVGEKTYNQLLAEILATPTPTSTPASTLAPQETVPAGS